MKQCLYIAFYMLGVVSILVLLISGIKLTPFFKWFFALNLIALSLIIFHLVKLRLIADFGQTKNTERYI
jgi:cytochrome b subunit of formate dehydrogenase